MTSFNTPNNTAKNNDSNKINLRHLQALFMQVDFISDYDISNDGAALNRSDNQLIYKIDTQVNSDTNNRHTNDADAIETWQVNQLITLFNATFAHLNVVLVRGHDEPEYFPANCPVQGLPARIVFAHGFFASALHELSHWCIAGRQRRTLPDFGYWYAPDGRDKAQQQAFEKVEIKPQALECLFNLACGRHFAVSQDNLFADFDTASSTFEQDVYQQVILYLEDTSTLPYDARILLSRFKQAHSLGYFNV